LLNLVGNKTFKTDLLPTYSYNILPALPLFTTPKNELHQALSPIAMLSISPNTCYV